MRHALWIVGRQESHTYVLLVSFFSLLVYLRLFNTIDCCHCHFTYSRQKEASGGNGDRLCSLAALRADVVEVELRSSLYLHSCMTMFPTFMDCCASRSWNVMGTSVIRLLQTLTNVSRENCQHTPFNRLRVAPTLCIPVFCSPAPN